MEEGWLKARAAFRLGQASGVQQQEMRRAFYAGVAFTLAEFAEIGEDHVSDEAGVAHLEMLNTECKMFAAMVGRVPGF